MGYNNMENRQWQKTAAAERFGQESQRERELAKERQEMARRNMKPVYPEKTTESEKREHAA